MPKPRKKKMSLATSFGPMIDRALKLLYNQSKETNEINLSVIPIDDDASAALATALRLNTTIHKLNISRTGLSEDGMVSIASALQQNKHLTNLHIHRNESCSYVYASLFATLQRNTTLRTIVIDIINENVDNFVNMMNFNTTLCKVFLNAQRGSPLTSENIVKLCRCVAAHKFLLGFDINALQAGDVDNRMETDAIVSVIANNKRLTYLHSDGINLQHDSIERALKFNYTLLDVDICDFDWHKSVYFLNRNKLLQWKVVHVVILDICIAMSPLQLPNYVLLEIIDWLPYYEVAISHLKKIRLIESVNRSCRQIIQYREDLVQMRSATNSNDGGDDDMKTDNQQINRQCLIF